jgi:hypothetical protein
MRKDLRHWKALKAQTHIVREAPYNTTSPLEVYRDIEKRNLESSMARMTRTFDVGTLPTCPRTYIVLAEDR